MFYRSVSCLFFWGLQQKIEPSWRNYLSELQNQAEYNTTKKKKKKKKKKQHCIWIFISNYNNASDIFELNETSGLSLIAGIHSTNLKTHERANNFFNPTNTQSSSEESLKEKRKMFIGMCSLSHTEFMSWHRRIHNPLKYLKWSILQKQSTIKSCQLFLQNAPS